MPVVYNRDRPEILGKTLITHINYALKVVILKICNLKKGIGIESE